MNDISFRQTTWGKIVLCSCGGCIGAALGIIWLVYGEIRLKYGIRSYFQRWHENVGPLGTGQEYFTAWAIGLSFVGFVIGYVIAALFLLWRRPKTINASSDNDADKDVWPPLPQKPA